MVSRQRNPFIHSLDDNLPCFMFRPTKKKKTHHQRRIYKQNMSFWIHSNYHSQLLPKKKKTLHVSLPILPIRHMWLIELHFQKNTKCLNCNKNGQTNNVCCNQIFYFLMWRRWNYMNIPIIASSNRSVSHQIPIPITPTAAFEILFSLPLKETLVFESGGESR